jgi:SEC-C motif-containing protein
MNDPICPCRKLAAEPIPYAACCKPALEDGVPAPSAEALMRSRYSAFALGKIDYLHDSLAPEARHDFDRKAVTRWSRSADWLGLDINNVEGGAPGDETGFVSFTAHYVLDGQRQAHRERSSFRFDRDDGRW